MVRANGAGRILREISWDGALVFPSKDFALERGDGVAGEGDGVGGKAEVDDSAAGGGLVAAEFGLAEAWGECRADDAVGATGDGVFIDAAAGGEEAGDDVVHARPAAGGLEGGGGCDDDAAGFDGDELAQVGFALSDFAFGAEFDEEVEFASADGDGADAEGLEESVGGDDCFQGQGWEVHFNAARGGVGC